MPIVILWLFKDKCVAMAESFNGGGRILMVLAKID